MVTLRKTLAVLGIAPVVIAGGVAILYLTIPTANTNRRRFDAIIVLGSPANPDGTPGPEQRERVLEGDREYRAGVAGHMIMTGGAAHNQYVESEVMARLAMADGIPGNAVWMDKRSTNTIENAFYAVQIMRGQHWHSAEVVSSSSHLPRASLIFEHFPIEWRMDAAPWPSIGDAYYPWSIYAAEALYCSKLRLFGFRSSRFLK